MIDIERLRIDSDTLKKSVARKGYDLDIESILTLDKTRRELIGEIETLRKEANEIAGQGQDADRERGKELKTKIKTKEGELKNVEEQLNERLLEIPNPPLDEVPDGKDESENVVVREVGKKPKLDFTPKEHVELGKELDIIDFESGSKVAGSGFYYLKNEGVFLEFALIQYALEFLAKEGFSLWFTPDLARDRFYLGTGYSPRGPEAQTYVIENSDLGLIATSEVTLAGIHADEILSQDSLPRLYAGYSHCFRQEAGAYGKYSKGLYRLHQFTKVEIFIYSRPEDSSKMHEKILDLEEKLWQSLDIPYRVVEMCAGDLGAQAARKLDLEAWMPGRDEWGEVTSTSNTTDFQSRRLNIRYRGSNSTEFVYTLNGTAIATSRAIIAILENFQQKDGSIKIPKALHKYLPFKEIKRQ